MSFVQSLRMKEIVEYCFSIGISLLLLSLLSNQYKWWDQSGKLVFSTWYWSAIPGALLSLVAIFISRGFPKIKFEAFALMLIPLFFSDWFTRDYNLLQGPPIRGEMILAALATFFCLRARLMPFPLVVIASSLILSATFFYAADGRILFSDDHPTFQFRLEQLRQTFPSIPFFHPLWNAGVDARDFFATGALNVFTIFAPLIYAFPVQSSYNVIITLLLFLVFPGALYLAAHYEGLKRPAPFIAALLGLTLSLLWYRWALKYGTIGFITAAAFIPLNLVVAGIAISPGRSIPRSLAILSIFSVSFSLCWSLNGFVLLPAIILACAFMKRVLRKRYIPYIIAGILLINIPWMLMFVKVSKVTNFVQAKTLVDARHVPKAEPDTRQAVPSALLATPDESTSDRATPRVRKGSFNLQASLDEVRNAAVSANPILFMLFVPALFALQTGSRAVFNTSIIALGIVGAVLSPVKPQLELSRMLLIMLLLLCIPVAEVVRQIFDRAISEKQSLSAIAAIALGSVLFAAPFSVAGILGNRSIEQYHFAGDEVQNLADAIETFGGDGRVMFSGFVLHDLSGGHLAPLAFRTSKPLMASSHVHDVWWYKPILPPEFRGRNLEGVLEYMDLFNVSAVLAHEPGWKHFFDHHKSLFERKWRGHTFSLFLRKNYQSNYFLSGSGKIDSVEVDKVKFSLDSASAVLKFNYFPFLKVEGCDLSAHEYSASVKLISLNNCPTHTTLILQSVSPLSRLLMPG